MVSFRPVVVAPQGSGPEGRYVSRWPAFEPLVVSLQGSGPEGIYFSRIFRMECLSFRTFSQSSTLFVSNFTAAEAATATAALVTQLVLVVAALQECAFQPIF